MSLFQATEHVMKCLYTVLPDCYFFHVVLLDLTCVMCTCTDADGEGNWNNSQGVCACTRMADIRL